MSRHGFVFHFLFNSIYASIININAFSQTKQCGKSKTKTHGRNILIYLDNCCFNRPFDDQSSLTIRLETEAKFAIQESIRAGKLKLGWSYILDYENQANPFQERRIEIEYWKAIADSFTLETQEIPSDMNKMVTYELKPLDALHVACAIALKCDFFLTVDKGILRKSASISNIAILSPIDFVIQQENSL